MTDGETSTASPPRRARAGNVLLWVARIGLATIFAMAAVPKFLGDPAMVATFEAIGVGQWLRHFTGVCELAGAIGLLIPGLTAAAALGLVGVMAGATVANVAFQPPVAVVTVLLGVLLGLVAWSCRSGLRTPLARLKR